MKEFDSIEEIKLALENVKNILRKHRTKVASIEQTLAKSQSLTDLQVIHSPAPVSPVAIQREAMDPDKIAKLEKSWTELQDLYDARKTMEAALISLKQPRFKITKGYVAMLSQTEAALLEVKTTIENTKKLLRRISRGQVPSGLVRLAKKVTEHIRAVIDAKSYTLTVTAHPSPNNDTFHFYALIELTDIMLGRELYSEYFIVIACDQGQNNWLVGTTTRIDDIGKIRGLKLVSDSAQSHVPKPIEIFKALNTLLHLDNLAPITSIPLEGKLGQLPDMFSRAMLIEEDLWLLLKKRLPPEKIEVKADPKKKSSKTDLVPNPAFSDAVANIKQVVRQLVFNTFGIKKQLNIGIKLGFITMANGKKRRAVRLRVADLGFDQFTYEKIDEIGKLLQLTDRQITELKKIVL